MDESKKEQIRGMLSMLKIIVPQMKSLEQVEAEAAECEADTRSYCAGYFQGVRDGIEIAQGFGRTSTRSPSRPAREPRDITNLWGLIP